MDLSDKTRYEGATTDQPSLVIKKVSRDDNGRYSCVLENKIGASESKSAATVTVLCKYLLICLLSRVSPVSMTFFELARNDKKTNFDYETIFVFAVKRFVPLFYIISNHFKNDIQT